MAEFGKTKITMQELKDSATVLAYNQRKQQYEPVVFQNGLKVDLDEKGFRRGIVLTPGDAPESTDNRLYNENGTLKFSGEELGGGSSSTNAAPISPSYVVLEANSSLPNERVLSAGTGLSLADQGANGTLKIDRNTFDDTYITLAASSNIPNERVLTAGTGVAITDRGPGNPATISLTYPTLPRHYHIHFFSTATANIYWPWYDIIETQATSLDAAQWRNLLIAPYDGTLKKVQVNCRFNAGTEPGETSITFHKNRNTTAVESQTINIDDWNTTYTATFSSSTFEAGDLLTIGMDVTNLPRYVVGSVIIEYDDVI